MNLNKEIIQLKANDKVIKLYHFELNYNAYIGFESKAIQNKHQYKWSKGK